MRDELPIRLAHRVVELENLPYGLSEMSSVKRVKNWYSQSFQELITFPHPDSRIPSSLLLNSNLLVSGNRLNSYFDPVDSAVTNNNSVSNVVQEYNQKFSACLSAIKTRHDPVVSTIALGIIELKNIWKKTSHPFHNNEALPLELQSFLDRFYLSRIGIRMLIGQHVALSKASLNHSTVQKDHVGIVCTKTPLLEVAEDAAENAKYICKVYFLYIRIIMAYGLLQKLNLWVKII